MLHNIELTSAEFLQLLADVQRSPIPEFSIDFFDPPVALDDIQLDRMYLHIVRISLFILTQVHSFLNNIVMFTLYRSSESSISSDVRGLGRRNGEFTTQIHHHPIVYKMLEDAFKGNNISMFYIRTLHLQDLLCVK